jgi:uncharacterized membrane protein YkoI
MKYIFLIMLATLTVLSACEKDEDDNPQTNNEIQTILYEKIDQQNYPEPIVDYVATNYPNNSINEIYMREYNNGISNYDVELDNSNELFFDDNGNYIGMDDDNININSSELPSQIIDYINNNYPDNQIVKAEKEFEDGTQVYEITLNNGFELYFTLDGTFLELEYDNSYISTDDVPQAILDYISTNYPDASILFIEKDIEDGVVEYEVYLDNGLELDFDANGNFSSSDDNYIPITDLPQSIIDYVETNYPNNTIDEAEIEFENGQEVYKVELDNDIELYFDMDGNFLWMEQD